MRTLSGTPKQDGFRIPGEFETRRRDFLIWPERTDTWRDGGKPAQRVLVEVVAQLLRFEPVTVFCSASQYENARARLPQDARVIEMTTDDAWAQDKGPFYVVNGDGDMRGVAWGWNAYGGLEGGLYYPWNHDAQFASKLLDLEGYDRYDARGMVLEGGAVQVDGEGTLIITENSVLNANRNPTFNKQEVESYLNNYLNVSSIIWLKDGMAFDETDGHADDVCFFVRPGVVALSWTDDVRNPQYPNLSAAYEVLSHATDAKGRLLEVHKIPIPEVLHISAEENEGIDISESSASRAVGLPLATTYINSYLTNGGLLMPQFGDPMDEVAYRAFCELMPERKIVAVPTREWSLAGGNIHCMTLQQPES